MLTAVNTSLSVYRSSSGSGRLQRVSPLQLMSFRLCPALLRLMAVGYGSEVGYADEARWYRAFGVLGEYFSEDFFISF